MRHHPMVVHDLSMDQRDLDKTLEWLRSLPVPERARMVRTIGDAQARQAIAALGDEAVYEWTRSATWAEVAKELGVSVRTVNKAVTRHRAALRKAAEDPS